jgi:hypothetical protein
MKPSHHSLSPRFPSKPTRQVSKAYPASLQNLPGKVSKTYPASLQNLPGQRAQTYPARFHGREEVDNPTSFQSYPASLKATWRTPFGVFRTRANQLPPNLPGKHRLVTRAPKTKSTRWGAPKPTRQVSHNLPGNLRPAKRPNPPSARRQSAPTTNGEYQPS